MARGVVPWSTLWHEVIGAARLPAVGSSSETTARQGSTSHALSNSNLAAKNLVTVARPRIRSGDADSLTDEG